MEPSSWAEPVGSLDHLVPSTKRMLRSASASEEAARRLAFDLTGLFDPTVVIITADVLRVAGEEGI